MKNLLNLETIDERGNPPETRLSDPVDVHNLLNRLLSNDRKRSGTRALVKGLFDGNPPYRTEDLTKAGQSYRCNVNWRVAESIIDAAKTGYYDLITEGPTLATITTYYGENDDEMTKWGEIITEEFDRLNKEDKELNYMFQTSQYNMLLYGGGPVIFDNKFSYRARPVTNLLIPDLVPSNINEWTVFGVTIDYPTDKLYGFVRDEKTARQAGWNVEAVRKVLMLSVPRGIWPQNRFRDWEWFQSRMRNNDISFSSYCDSNLVAHFYYREYPRDGEPEGKISHCIVDASRQVPEYLYQNLNEYDDWTQVIAPFYYDIGDGTHHSVKGLGVKAYGALECYNRLQCSVVDAASFGASMHLQSATENMREQASVVEMGPFKVWPQGFTIIPNLNLGQMLEGPIAIKEDLKRTLTANISAYRQDTMRRTGNPVTASQVQYEAENDSIINKTGIMRYLDQADAFWGERYRRVLQANSAHAVPGVKEARDFIKRCKERGVPDEAMKKACVRSTRTIGYGSAFNRLMALNRMFQRYALYPSDGQQKLLEDLTAADVGYSLMRRYMPDSSDHLADERVLASLQIAAARSGVTPVVTSDQDHIIMAETFIQESHNAINGISQGANPIQVVEFVEALGPAIGQHINYAMMNPVHKDQAKQIMKQFKELASATDQLKDRIGQMQQESQQQQQQQMAMMSDEQMKQMKVENDIQRKNTKAANDIQLKEAKTRQAMAINDIKTAQNIRLNKMKASAESES